MDLRLISQSEKNQYNKKVTHVIQSWEWGEFRKKLGLPLLRYGIYQNNKLKTAFELTLHQIPFTSFNIGYLPKGPFPDKELAQALLEIGKKYHCAAIKVEPNIITWEMKTKDQSINPRFKQSPKALFTKYNFIIELTKPEAELLNNLHPKTRYNIKVAQKHLVKVEERVDDEAFEIYLKLYFDTVQRQNYHGHNPSYHRLAWQTLRVAKMARLLIAFYQPPHSSDKIPLTAWMLLNFQDTLYYPYGGSSPEYRNTMSSTLLAWEAIKLGKRLKLKHFDLWGALGPNQDQSHPWYGFHHFKKGLGGELVEYLGTYDLIFNPVIYYLFTLIDKFTSLKVLLLKIIRNR